MKPTFGKIDYFDRNCTISSSPKVELRIILQISYMNTDVSLKTFK